MDFYDIKLGDCLSMIENGAIIKQQKGSKVLPGILHAIFCNVA